MLPLLALPALAAAQQGKPDPAPRYDLTPRYAPGLKREVEAKFLTIVKIRMQVPTAKLDRTSSMEQGGLRRFRDHVKAVRAGRPIEIRRRFLEDYDALRDHGEHVVRRTPTPLHRRRIVLTVDAKGTRTITDPDKGTDVPIPKAATAHETLADRYELVLPEAQVAVGDRWQVSPKRMAQLFSKGFHQPRGSARAKLEAVEAERLDPHTPPERYAKIKVSLRVEGPVDDTPQAARRTLRLKGTIRFSLARRQIVTVSLAGRMRLVQKETQEGHTRILTGDGSAKILRRIWFPRRPKKDAKPPAKKTG